MKKITNIRKVKLPNFVKKIMYILFFIIILLFLVKIKYPLNISWQNFLLICIFVFILGVISGAYKIHKDLHS